MVSQNRNTPMSNQIKKDIDKQLEKIMKLQTNVHVKKTRDGVINHLTSKQYTRDNVTSKEVTHLMNLLRMYRVDSTTTQDIYNQLLDVFGVSDFSVVE